ncbi:MAG: nucleotide exchange factor GrpE [Spirochaeta sp.]|jgi:molecular chaperone GrpE|nr:nucleotide exchange factor GrpE [Spirochaeta sp.]
MAEEDKAGAVEAEAETTAAGPPDDESVVVNATTTAGEEMGDLRTEKSEQTGQTESEVMRTLQTRIQELELENTELKNQYLRKQADLENYRKRMIRDKEQAVQFSNQQLLLDMTSIIDDFERAIRSAEESRDYDSFHDGIVLIENQLTNMLERKWGLKRFDSDGEVFDPQRHEAVTTEPRDDHEESIVLEDYQKGYMLNDRVLRSAKVKVSMPSTDNQ